MAKMSPLEMLDAAIESGDIKKIKAARKLLAKPVKKLAKPVETLDSSEENEVESLESESPVSNIPDDDGGGQDKKYCVKRPIDTKPRKNKYKDRGQLKEEVETDQKLLSKIVSIGREKVRPPHKKVKATCRDCNKTYMVDPSMHVLSGSVEGHAITFLCSSCLYKKIGR